MIVVDTEFTSLNFKGGLWQIGAVDLDNPKNTFLEEAKLEEVDEIQQAALDVVGKTEEELRDKNRQSQKEMLEHFFEWAKSIKVKNLVCQGQWDFPYILIKANKFGLEFPFPHRCFDLHSIAQVKHFEVKGGLLIKEDKSGMGLDSVLEFCGIKDERRRIDRKGVLVKEGKPHNALEDAKLEAEAFSRLVYGKNLLPEFSKFKIPEYLLK